MNKKFLAIAVGAAMVAGATTATAGDEPTFYGKIHVSLDSMNNGTSGSATEDGTFISSNSSRLGIKGKVDLSGSLKAVYKYEMSTSYDDGAAVNGNRNAYLGLNSGGHTVIAGRHDMPYKTVGRKFDLFGDTIGDTRTMTRHSNASVPICGCGADWADRRSNVLMYTGKFDAVGVKVAYGSEEGTDDTSDLGLGITYKGGPIKVMFAHETHGKGNLGGVKDSTGDVLNGSYKMGNLKFLAGYHQVSDVAGIGGIDVSGYMLGAAMKSGMNTFKIQYSASEFDVTGFSDTAGTMIAVGADHNFSKKTKVYVVYATVSNDDQVDFQLGRGTGHDATTSASAPGDGGSGLSLGMIHKF